MLSLNQLEERHLGALAGLRDAESIELLDSRHGDIGPAFEEIEPLVLFDEAWGDLHLDADMLGDSLRFEVAAHWESGPAHPPFSGEYRIPSPTEILTQATDYRYAGTNGQDAELRATELPDQVVEASIELAEALELPFAGIDNSFNFDCEPFASIVYLSEVL